MTYTDAHISLLEQIGKLSNILVQMKSKVGYEEAKKILESIVEDHENVRFCSENIICIYEKEDDVVQKENKNKQEKKRKSKWKDITKP